MSESHENQSLFERASFQRKVVYALYAVCAVLFALDFFVHRHVEHPIEHWWGFYAIYGFIALVVIVMGAKLLRVFVRRDENYYDDA